MVGTAKYVALPADTVTVVDLWRVHGPRLGLIRIVLEMWMVREAVTQPLSTAFSTLSNKPKSYCFHFTVLPSLALSGWPSIFGRQI